MNGKATFDMCRVIGVGLLTLAAGCASLSNRWSLPSHRPLTADSIPPGVSSGPVSMSVNDDIHIEIPDDIPEFQGPDADAEAQSGTPANSESESESTPYRTTIRGQGPVVR